MTGYRNQQTADNRILLENWVRGMGSGADGLVDSTVCHLLAIGFAFGGPYMAKDPQHQPRRKEAGSGLDQLGNIHKSQAQGAVAGGSAHQLADIPTGETVSQPSALAFALGSRPLQICAGGQEPGPVGDGAEFCQTALTHPVQIATGLLDFLAQSHSRERADTVIPWP